VSIDWKHKDVWKHEGAAFTVEVSRHSVEQREEPSGCYDAEGPHRWCVYAYVYPKHPLFAAFDPARGMWEQPHLPFHGGVSYFRTHRKQDGSIASHQLGADYNHLHDWRFTQHATKDEAREVFVDAAELIRALEQHESAVTEDA
jgi:hypothetical protein